LRHETWFSTVFGTILCPRLFPDFLPEVAPALGARQSTPTIIALKRYAR
jgi:hypothetical protein